MFDRRRQQRHTTRPVFPTTSSSLGVTASDSFISFHPPPPCSVTQSLVASPLQKMSTPRSEDSDVLQETTTLTRSVFQSVWDQFYAWEVNHSQHAISSLARSVSTISSDPIDGAVQFQALKLTVQPIDALSPIEPCSPYESCTSCSRSMTVGDDSDYMPFLPYADDPQFDVTKSIQGYRYLAWQDRKTDPDCKQYLSSQKAK